MAEHSSIGRSPPRLLDDPQSAYLLQAEQLIYLYTQGKEDGLAAHGITAFCMLTVQSWRQHTCPHPALRCTEEMLIHVAIFFQ